MLLAKPPIPQSSVAPPSANHCDTKSQRLAEEKMKAQNEALHSFVALHSPPAATPQISPLPY